MLDINQVSFALNMVAKELQTTDREKLDNDYWDTIQSLSEPQYKKLLALCFNHKVQDINKLLGEWKIIYQKA